MAINSEIERTTPFNSWIQLVDWLHRGFTRLRSLLRQRYDGALGIIVCSGVWVSPAVARWQPIGISQLGGTFLTMEQQSLLLAEAEKQSNQRLAQAIGADNATNEDVTAPTINTCFWAEIEERFGGRGRRNQ